MSGRQLSVRKTFTRLKSQVVYDNIYSSYYESYLQFQIQCKEKIATWGFFLKSVFLTEIEKYPFLISSRIPTVKLKIPGKAFLKSRTSVTFKL